jgi:hypothetical protein
VRKWNKLDMARAKWVGYHHGRHVLQGYAKKRRIE